MPKLTEDLTDAAAKRLLVDIETYLQTIVAKPSDAPKESLTWAVKDAYELGRADVTLELYRLIVNATTGTVIFPQIKKERKFN